MRKKVENKTKVLPFNLHNLLLIVHYETNYLTS